MFISYILGIFLVSSVPSYVQYIVDFTHRALTLSMSHLHKDFTYILVTALIC